MRKWILLALVNWLRKPANRQKAKNAWKDLRGRSAGRHPTRQSRPASRHSTSNRPGDTFDHRP